MLKALKVKPETSVAIINYTQQDLAPWKKELESMQGYYITVMYDDRSKWAFVKEDEFHRLYDFIVPEKPRAFVDIALKVNAEV